MFYLIRFLVHLILFFFFFNDTATTEIYTLSLHDALPISAPDHVVERGGGAGRRVGHARRSEEHTSELQSRGHLVCRLLLEKKNAQCLALATFDPNSKNTEDPNHDNMA